jgi:hypothetical protein
MSQKLSSDRFAVCLALGRCTSMSGHGWRPVGIGSCGPQAASRGAKKIGAKARHAALAAIGCPERGSEA